MTDPLPAVDFGESAPKGPTDDQIARVRSLAERAVALERRAAELEDELDRLNLEKSDILDRALVQAMQDARLEVWPMPGGLQFEINTLVNGSIPKGREEEAFARLTKDGHGDLIKRRFTIMFGREDEAWARRFERDLAKRKKPLNVERKTWIEPQTFGAFVREQLRLAAAEGRDPEELCPSDLYGVFKRTYARLVAPKAPRSRKL